MRRIRLIGPIIVIILFFPLTAPAHEGEVHFSVDPTTLPGERGYTWEQVRQWVDINLLTLSTKGKQEKKLAQAEERLAEFMALTALGSDTDGVLGRYRDTLFDAGDMARKIIIIDGAQIAIAERLEERTRLQEAVLIGLLRVAPLERRGQVTEALITARLNNEDMFLFMARNYQFNEADIKKHRQILGAHIAIVEEVLRENPNAKAAALLAEAKKHQAAGLNVEGYEIVKKAKDAVYSKL